MHFDYLNLDLLVEGDSFKLRGEVYTVKKVVSDPTKRRGITFSIGEKTKILRYGHPAFDQLGRDLESLIGSYPWGTPHFNDPGDLIKCVVVDPTYKR